METVAVIVWLIIIFFIGRWLFKTYYIEPIKDIKAGLYKFDKFKPALADFKVELNPIKGSENTLVYREQITNGVESISIGHFEYSINDYIQYSRGEKIHNYYFEVKAKIKEIYIVEKSSNYFKEANYNTCKTQISILRERVIKNKSFIKAYKEYHLKEDFNDLYKKVYRSSAILNARPIYCLYPYRMPEELFTQLEGKTVNEALLEEIIDDLGDDKGDFCFYWEEYDINYALVQGYRILIQKEAIDSLTSDDDVFSFWKFFSDEGNNQCFILA